MPKAILLLPIPKALAYAPPHPSRTSFYLTKTSKVRYRLHASHGDMLVSSCQPWSLGALQRAIELREDQANPREVSTLRRKPADEIKTASPAQYALSFDHALTHVPRLKHRQAFHVDPITGDVLYRLFPTREILLSFGATPWSKEAVELEVSRFHAGAHVRSPKRDELVITSKEIDRDHVIKNRLAKNVKLKSLAFVPGVELTSNPLDIVCVVCLIARPDLNGPVRRIVLRHFHYPVIVDEEILEPTTLLVLTNPENKRKQAMNLIAAARHKSMSFALPHNGKWICRKRDAEGKLLREEERPLYLPFQPHPRRTEATFFERLERGIRVDQRSRRWTEEGSERRFPERA